MHLLAVQTGTLPDGNDAVDLGQSPAEIVVLSAADTDLACLAQAWQGGPGGLRLANLMRLGHNLSVDLYVEQVVERAKLVVVRLLGGRAYWPYGVEQIAAAGRRKGIAVAFVPGSAESDPDLVNASTLPPEAVERLRCYLLHGGPDNARALLAYAGSLLGRPTPWLEPRPLPPAGRHCGDPADGRPRAVLVFYRALVLASDLAPIEALIAALRGEGLAVTALFVHSLKDPIGAGLVRDEIAATQPDIVLNATGFAVSAPGRAAAGPFGPADCPVLQVILAGDTEAGWRAGRGGLGPRDLAMNVSLPEIDGRILARAISFKALVRDEATECDIAHHAPLADRVAFTAQLAANWARLRRKPAASRRVALILANYPHRDGRLGNGVGLDTPAAAAAIVQALAQAGYDVPAKLPDGQTLIARLLGGVTNGGLAGRDIRETLALSDYRAWFEALPASVRDAVTACWGAPEDDPWVLPAVGAFAVPVLRLGGVAVAVQPARAGADDAARRYHDAELPPPHRYLAFYLWLRQSFAADAIVHLGKHGTLEWLPGKAVALSAECFPELALGPLPHLYPFIVNDPGEGTQAKRRTGAVIVDHLTPPLTRAETYGPLRELERLVDEYYEAAGLDPRRLAVLRREILSLSAVAGLEADLGIDPDDDPDAALKKLDNHLCELKELQIRDGLHIFGQSPTGAQGLSLLVALARVRRGPGDEAESLTRALAADLGLGFDPLDCRAADPWAGPRPPVLADICGDPWRSVGDSVERLEALALALVAGEQTCPPEWSRTQAVLGWIETVLRPTVAACGPAEMAALLAGLDGRFVAPGPSGAPTRGRPDVLPTGRNFFSIDPRTMPTPAAWTLVWKSVSLLLERHLQDHGDWPRAMAVTAWGTSAMRTGGDDLAQALALMGVRPHWEIGSGRVSGYEIMPAGVLDRPRVDVTLRVSGLFRDAFPGLIDLFDAAVRAVAQLDEPPGVNPLAARVAADRVRLEAGGLSPEDALRRAAYRVFGAMPGTYGSGIEALVEGGGWGSRDDLAAAYIAWSGWAYGGGVDPEAGQSLFADRLASVEAVVQNQDNREHDLLDSAEYALFEGGLAAAVEAAAGRAPVVYHPDHSRPDSPRINTLDEEIARILRGRMVNPKWIAGAMRHGYKGASEMAAGLDHLLAFAATTHAVRDHHFELVAQAYLKDDAVRGFLAEVNPAALADIRAALRTAFERGLWRPRDNRIHDLFAEESPPSC